jgi:hypothetical protein
MVGMVIPKTNAGFGIPASGILLGYLTVCYDSVTGPIPASLNIFSPVPDCTDAGRSGIQEVTVTELGLKHKCIFCYRENLKSCKISQFSQNLTSFANKICLFLFDTL